MASESLEKRTLGYKVLAYGAAAAALYATPYLMVLERMDQWGSRDPALGVLKEHLEYIIHLLQYGGESTL